MQRVLMLAISVAVMTWAASAVAAPNPTPHGNICNPHDVKRADYFVEAPAHLAPPNPYNQTAQLQVHRVSPIPPGPAVDQSDGHAADHNPWLQCPAQAVVLVHGCCVDSATTFDLQCQDYSVMEALARAGIDAFAVNLVGWGLSSRFIMDDPCSASNGAPNPLDTVNNPPDQQTLLIPNPLSETCDYPLPFKFTNTSAARDQLDAVVDDVLSRTGVAQVTLYGWSLGGAIVGDYTLRHPEKVKNIILESPLGTGTAVDPPNPLPSSGHSIAPLRSRENFFDIRWGSQLACPGQRDPAILDPIWQGVRANDPVASNWGPTDPQTGAPGGFIRSPSGDVWGWSPQKPPQVPHTTIANVTVPALFVWGYLDNVTPVAPNQYPAIGSSTKVLVKIQCASHYMMWESSASTTWQGGPHKILRDAAVEWIKSEMYQGKSLGTFQVDANGNITGPF